MKENNVLITIIIVIVSAISVFSIYFFSMTQNKPNTSDSKSVGEIIQEPVETIEQEETSINEDEENQPDNNVIMPETATKLIISKGIISYSIKKTYVEKPAINVVGKTDMLEGTGWVDLESQKGYVNAQLDFLNIKTDSSKRDQDIRPLFKETQINIDGIFEGLGEMKIGREFQLKAPLKLTINGLEKEIVFNIKAKVNKDMSLVASGNSEIFISDFGITSPSLASVFSTDDKVEIMFEIEAEKVTE